MLAEDVKRGLLTPPISRNLDQRVVFGKGSGLRVVGYSLDGKPGDVAVCRELHNQGSQDFNASLAYLGQISSSEHP